MWLEMLPVQPIVLAMVVVAWWIRRLAYSAEWRSLILCKNTTRKESERLCFVVLLVGNKYVTLTFGFGKNVTHTVNPSLSCAW